MLVHRAGLLTAVALIILANRTLQHNPPETRYTPTQQQDLDNNLQSIPPTG